jgi:TRAP-type C4-dicarboxylate transport system substrate-binding protein
MIMRSICVLAAGMLAVSGAMMLSKASWAEALPETIPEADKAFRMSADWADLKLDKYGATKVTYTGAPIEMRVSMHTPPVSSLTKFVLQSLKVLEKMSDGKIKPVARSGGVVHSVSEGFEANRNGITDVSPCFVFLNPTNFPLTQALSLPGLFPNAAVLQAVAEELYPKYFKPEFERQGVYALGIVGSPHFLIFSNEPITKLDDLKGKKVRSGGGINQRIFQALGASTVNMSSRDFQQGLQRGLIDVVYTSDTAGMIFKLTDVAKHHTDVELNSTPLEWCMNKRFYDKLPPDLKAVVNEWARAMFQAQTQQAFLRVTVIARNLFRKAGMQFHKLSPEEEARWEKAYAGVTDSYLKDMEAKGLPANQMLADIKAGVAKYKDLTFNDLMKRAIDAPSRNFWPGLN